MASEKFQRNGKLLHSTVGGDVLALDVDRGRCFGMQEVTVRIWDLLEHPMDVATICATLLEEYEVDPAQCEAQVQEFIGNAVAEGIITRAPDGPTA